MPPLRLARQETTTSMPKDRFSMDCSREGRSVTSEKHTFAPRSCLKVSSLSFLPLTPLFSLATAITLNPLLTSSLTTNLPMYPVEPTTRTLISLGLLFLKEGEG